MVGVKRVVAFSFLSDSILLNKIFKKKVVSKITAFFFGYTDLSGANLEWVDIKWNKVL